MTKVNVSAPVGMSATVGEMSATVGKFEYAVRNLRLEIVIHNFAGITFEDTWNNISKAH